MVGAAGIGAVFDTVGAAALAVQRVGEGGVRGEPGDQADQHAADARADGRCQHHAHAEDAARAALLASGRINLVA